jgi:autotransporter-associated beta strand protein
MLMKSNLIRRSSKMKRPPRDAASNSGSKALAGSISGFCRVLAVSAITALGLGEARAATRFWDANLGGTLGGNGIWDLTTANWWTGNQDVVWPNTVNDEAVFAFSTAGGISVTVGDDLTVGALTFTTSGYSLSPSLNTFGITIGGARTITVTHPSDIATINVGLRGTGGFTKTGAGKLVLTADSSPAVGFTGAITGGVTLAGGTLVLDYGANFVDNFILASSNALTITSTSTFQFLAKNGGSALSLGALTFSGGEGTVIAQADSPLDLATMTFNSFGGRAAGATGSFVQNGTGAGNTKIVLSGQATGFINQGLFFTNGFGNNNFAYNDAGGFVRGINYGVDGNTATEAGSSAGISAANAGKHVQVTADVTGQGNLSILTLKLRGSAFTSGGGILQNPGTTITLTNAGILKSNGGFAPISGGTIAAGANELVIRADAPGDILKISSVITGTGGLTKSGLGALEINPQTPGALSLGGSSTTIGSSTVTLASTAPAGLVVGMPVFGPGIPANTFIKSISGTTVSLSQSDLTTPVPATVTSAAPLIYNATVGGGTTIVTLTPAEAGTLSIGQPVTGTNVPANTTVFAINTGTGAVTLTKATTGTASPQTITFSGATLAFGSTQNFSATAGPLPNDHAVTEIGSTAIRLLANVASLVAGMSVDGPGISPGTTIASINGINVTLSQVATASSSNTAVYNTQTGNGLTTLNLNSAQASTLVIGTLVTGQNILPNTFIQNINIGTGVITLSQAMVVGPSSFNDVTFGGVTLAFGTSTLTLTPGQAAGLVVGSTITGPNITPGTTILSINTGTGVVSLSDPTTGTASTQFLTFGGATAVNINSTYGGLTRINAGVFAASSSGIPAGGTVTVGGGAEFAAVNSVITNDVTFTGGNAKLSGSGGNNGGFSGTITAGVNDFQLLARDYSSSANSNLNISGTLNGSGTMTIPTGSGGIVTLSGDNSGANGFSGPIVIDTNATLSIARLKSVAKGNPISTSGTLILALDGDGGAAYASGGNGTGAPQTLSFAQPINITMVSDATIQPDRDGTAYSGLFRAAGNKTIQLGSLSLTNLTLHVQNNAGSGVAFTGSTFMTDGFSPGVFDVVNATASNAVAGLALNGIVSAVVTGSGNTVLQKVGNGTLVLGNSGNTFGGFGSGILIQRGVISVASDGALGNAGHVADGLNPVYLQWDGGGTPAALRATDNFTTNRNIYLNTASLTPANPTATVPQNAIEVTVGKTLTMAAPIGQPFISTPPVGTQPSTYGIVKNDNGTLLITANNGATLQSFTPVTPVQDGDQTITLTPAQAKLLPPRGTLISGGGNIFPTGTIIMGIDTVTGIVTLSDIATGTSSGAINFDGQGWTGPVRINAGAVKVQTATALGTGSASTVTVAQTGAAFQIAGNTTVANRLILSGTGIGSAGALQGMGAASTNTFSGQLVMAAGVTIGADLNSTLNITGGITGSQALSFNNAGTINITGQPLDPTYSFNGDVQSGTNLIQNIPPGGTDSIVVGQVVLSDPNFPPLFAANTTVTAKTATTITISALAIGSSGAAPITSRSLISSLTKAGTGTLTLGVNSPGFTAPVTVNEGTFRISGNGVALGNPAAANTTTLQGPSSVLLIDDTVGATTLHMGSGVYTPSDDPAANTFTLTPAQSATVTVGVPVFGTNIAAGSFVTAVNTTTGVVTVSINKINNVAGQSLTFGSNRNLTLTGGRLTYNGGTGASVETFGALTLNRAATNVILSTPGAGGTVSLVFKTLGIAGDASVDFQGTGLGVNGTNKITFIQTAPGTTNALIQRATINGNDFVAYNAIGAMTLTTNAANPTITVPATQDLSFFSIGQAVTGTGITAGTTISNVDNVGHTITLSLQPAAGTNFLSFGNANGIQAFKTYNTTNDITNAPATATMDITLPPDMVASTTINGFRIRGTTTASGTVTQGLTLTLTSGAILSSSGSNQVNFPILAFGGTEAFVSVNTGTLSIGSLLNGSGGFVKAGAGTLTFNPIAPNRAGIPNITGQTLNGNFAVNAGELILGGGNNTLTPNQFILIAPGATLNLNGTFQYAFGTRGDGAAIQGNAGTITNSNASPAGLILGLDNAGVNFGGVITQAGGAGAMSFLKSSNQTYNFYNANTYSGATLFAGGINELRDGGALTATASIVLNYARLALNDNVTFALANRVNTAAPLILRGGSLTYTGRAQTETTQAVGTVTLFEGQNMIQSVAGGTGVNSAVLTLASFTRSAGSSATVRFVDNGMGLIGSNGRVVITSPPTLSGNLIGPWAVVDREFASYIPTLGVGALSQTGFAGYSTNFLNRQPLATDNIRTTLSIPGLAVDTTVNTLAVNTVTPNVNAAITIDLGGKKLTLAGGGLILAENNTNAAAAQSITVQNGTLTSGTLNVGGDLYIHALNLGGVNNTFTVSAGITNNGTGAVRLIKASGAADAASDFLTLSGTNTYTGGTVVNGGTLIIGATGNIPAAATAANGLRISGGESSGLGSVLQDPGGTIASSNIATISGMGLLNLGGDNTLAGLVLTNGGGGNIAPTVITFRSLTPLGTGTLTLGSSGIVTTSSNPAAQSLVAGRIDFGGALSTVNVASYVFSVFTDFAPTTAGLILQGVTGSVGGFNKTGTGVLQFNAQEVFTGPVNVNAGGTQIGIANGGSRFSSMILGAGTRLNLNGFSTILGSLGGSGTVTNAVANLQTLTVGFDNSDTTFSGQFSRFNDATPAAVALIKVGSGTMTITSAQDAFSGSSGGVTVNGGGLTYSGAGKAYPSTALTPVTYTVSATGTLTIDNSGIAATDRLGLNAANGTLTLAGGTLAMIGNVAGSSESINTLNFGNGASTIRLTPGAGGATTFTVNGAFSDKAGQDSGLITGGGLGGSGAGSVNVVFAGIFNTIGGGTQLTIRPDIIGDATGGPGTGFVTRASGNVLRPLDQSTELVADMVQAAGLSGFANVGLTSANNSDPAKNKMVANQTINSLTLVGSGTPTLTSGIVTSAGIFGPSGSPLTLTVTSGGFLALGNATIGIGALASPSGATHYFHVVGSATNLDLNAAITAGNAGIVKAGDGTLTLNVPQLYTGTLGTNGTTINGGTLKLNAGNNTILFQTVGAGNIAAPLSLFLNGGTLDLNGTSQVVERITSNNILPGAAGTIINSGGVTVTLTSATATSAVFSGSIGTGIAGAGNAIDFVKSGNSTLTLAGVNTYTGTTLIRGGILELRDSGTLATSGVTVNFGTLSLNQGGLNPVAALNPVRIPSTSPLTLNGGIVSQNSGGSLDSSATFNTVNLASGASTFTQSTLQSAGSSSLISIGSLAQQSPAATVTFTSTLGTLGGGGLNNNQIQIGSITPSGGSAGSPASLLVNNMLPAWMTVNGNDFAGYLASPVNGSQGIGAFASAGFPTYSINLAPIAHSADNLNVTATALPVSGRTINSFAIRGGNALVPLNLPTDTLSIASGGLLVSSGQTGTIQGGRITVGSVANASGTLYATVTGALTLNSQVVNNGNQLYSANTDGFSNIVTVGSISGLSVGQQISGPGIPAGATITAIATTGQPFAAGVVRTIDPSNPSGATIASTVPISSPAAFTFAAPTGTSITAASFKINDIPKINSFLTGGSPSVALINTTSLAVGMYASGPGIPAGTTVTAIGTNSVTLSNNAIETLSPQQFILSAGATTNLISMQPGQYALLAVGMAVTGTNIQPNTTITNLFVSTSNVTGTTTNNNNVISGVNTAGLLVGMSVTGSTLPPGEVITAINPGLGQVTVSIAPGVQAGTSNLTFTGNNAQLSLSPVGAQSLRQIAFNPTLNFARLGTNEAMRANLNNTSTNVVVSNNTGLAVGMSVTGPGIQAGTVITLINGTNITISQAAVNTANNVNLVFGSSVSVGDGSTGAVSFVKTGTGTLTLSPQLVMNGGLISGLNTIALETVSGLSPGMPVFGNGIPQGATIASIITTNGVANITITGGNASVNGASQLSFGLGLNNTYTGGTFVNQGTLNLGGLPGTTVIPGDIEINNATVSTLTTAMTAATVTTGSGTITLPGVGGLLVGMRVIGNGIPANSTIFAISGNNITITNGSSVVGGPNIALTFGNSGQIISTSNVTMKGGAAFNLFGPNTLASLTINNTGGAGAPTVALGTGGTLTLTNTLNVTNDSLSFTPVINGTNSTLVLSNSTISTSGASPESLLVTVPITPGTAGGTLIKTGPGSLILTPSFAVTGTTTNTSNQVAVVNKAGLSIGMAVTGLNVPAGAVISDLNAGNPGTITISVVTNASGAATGALTFTGNTFTGGVNLTQGSIILGASSTPATGAGPVTSGPLGTGPLNITAGTALLSDGTLRTILNTVNIATNAIFGSLPGNGTAVAGNGVTLAGSVVLTGGGSHTLEVNGLLNTTTISGVLNGSGATLTLNKTGTGTLVLSNGGNILPAAPATTFNVNGGVLRLASSTAVPAGLNLSVAQGAAYDIAGQNQQVLLALSGSGMVTNSGAAQTLFIGGTSTGDVTNTVNATFDGTLTAATLANLIVSKVGLGSQTLTGASNYTGATNVISGKLIVNGSLANTLVTVGPTASAASLGGTGTIGNGTAVGGTGINVTVSGTGTIDLTNGSIGTLTINPFGSATGLSLANGSKLMFDLGTNFTDQINIINGGKILVNTGTTTTVSFTQLAGTPLQNGIYTLISFNANAGTSTGTPNPFVLGAGAPPLSSLAFNSSALTLNVGGVPQFFFWKGSSNNDWSKLGPTNWTSDAAGTTLTTDVPNATSDVTFVASGAANVSTVLNADFTINTLTFNSTSNADVTIASGLTPHVLTLNNNLTMNAGTANVTISTAGLTLGGPQTWTINTIIASPNQKNLTVSAPLTGSSGLTISAPGTATGRVILSGNNSNFTGGITIAGNNGATNTTVQLGTANANALGASTNPLVVNSGALDLNGNSVTVGSLSSATAGGFIKNTLASTISTLAVNQSSTTTFQGAIQDGTTGGTPGKIALSMTGFGTLTLITGPSTFTGGTTITNGTVRLGNGGNESVASLGTGPITINGGGFLSFAPGGVTTNFIFANNFSLNGGTIQSTGGNHHLANNAPTPTATITIGTLGATFTPPATAGQDLWLDGILTSANLANPSPINIIGSAGGRVILTNNNIANNYNGTVTTTNPVGLQLSAASGASSTALGGSASLVNNSNGLTFGSTITTATIGSIAGTGNFALQNTAASPVAVALTVGLNNTSTTYTGIISNSAATIPGQLIKDGAGTLTLQPTGGAANTYRGNTTVTGTGTLRVSNSSSNTNSVTGLGNVNVTGTATLGGTGMIQGGTGATLGAVTLNGGTFLDPGLAPFATGTLRIGSGTVGTTLTLNTNSTLKSDVGAASNDRVLVVGSAGIAGAKLAINLLSTPTQGLYTLLDATTGLTGTFSNGVTTGGDVSGGVTGGLPNGYQLVYNSGSVDLQHLGQLGTPSTAADLQVITGGILPFSFVVQNTAPAGSANISFTAMPGQNTTGTLNPSPVVVGAGSFGTGTGLNFDSNGVGVGVGLDRPGSFTVNAPGASPSSATGTVYVDVLDHASIGAFSGGTVNLGNVRVGYANVVTSTPANSLNVTNAAGTRVDLMGSAPANGLISLSSLDGVQAGTSGSISASLALGQGTGAISQGFTYTFGDDSTLIGNNPTLGTVNITVIGNVYNGIGVWGSAATGTWGDFSKWTMPGGYPGLDGSLSINDTATFGNNGTVSGPVTLDSVAPSINQLTLNNVTGTISQGTGSNSLTMWANSSAVNPSVNVNGGTPTISAPMVLQNNTTFTTSPTSTLTVSGDVSDLSAAGKGPAGIIKAGTGTMNLTSTNNSYTGKTSVTGGTLSVASAASLGAVPPSGVVPDQIGISNGATLAFTDNAALVLNQGITMGTGGGSISVASTKTVSVSGALSGTATLTKSGQGTLDLRNTASGVEGPIVLTGQTLGQYLGTLTPFAGVPASISTGGLTFSGGTLAIDILGTNGQGNPGGHDSFSANNTNVPGATGPSVYITAPTNLTINFGGFVPNPSNPDVFTIITDQTRLGSDNYASTFFVNGVAFVEGTPANFGGRWFNIDYNGGGGSDIILTSVVPEPGTAALLLAGVAFLGITRRRRPRNLPFGS